jgi:prepilin-type N-terminal cleavage/methylation domain-containing protein
MTGARMRHDEGFTLVELMTVAAILAILVMVAIASFTLTRERSLAVTCRHNQRIIMEAIVQYQSEHFGAVPPTLGDLDPSFAKQTKGFGTCPLDGTPYFYDDETYLDPGVDSFHCVNHPFTAP